jgi:2-amino-4-hydroxy-6-hydroxymethyldihydropteridine diphosphokinase / dihydropteroate synthase
MLILGLGSNVGDRLGHLRQTLLALKQLPQLQVKQVSPIYLSDALLPEHAPPDWDKPHLNAALRCETSLKPQALLSELKRIEAQIGGVPKIRHWGPRIIDIDILAWDDLVIKNETLSIPHAHLTERAFQLCPLSDIAPLWVFPEPGAYQGKTASELVEKWGSPFTGDAPLHTRQIYQRIDTPRLVGVLNVTPDSFSDGGTYFSLEQSLIQAKQLIADGAEIIDIGAESTAPNAAFVDAPTEWRRLQPLLEMLKHAKTDFLIPPLISIDTRHASTAEQALAYDIDWINDVTGLEDQMMQKLIAETKVHCVMMHHLTIPASLHCILPRNQDPVKIILEWGKKQLDMLSHLGINPEKIIFDPGIGFGKAKEQSLALIQHAAQFKQLGLPILYGHSRKSFLTSFTAYEAKQRDIETIAVSLYLAKQHIDYLRVHAVEPCARALRVDAYFT